MKGYDLSSGNYTNRILSDNEMWESFNWLFSKYSKNDSSYKFIFFKSILDCLDKKDKNGHISFDVLFANFTKIAWNLVLKYGISQKGKVSDGRITLLEKALKQDFGSDDSYEELFESDRKKICSKIKRDCKTYVVGALYGDMKGNLYSFSKNEEWIEVNPQMEMFLKKNIGIIENLNYYKWAKFYQVVNDREKEEELKKWIDADFIRKDESIFRAVLAFEFERPENISRTERVNTVELLIESEGIDIDTPEDIEVAEAEDELYKDISHLKSYMADPIMLINQIKKEKGLVV